MGFLFWRQIYRDFLLTCSAGNATVFSDFKSYDAWAVLSSSSETLLGVSDPWPPKHICYLLLLAVNYCRTQWWHRQKKKQHSFQFKYPKWLPGYFKFSFPLRSERWQTKQCGGGGERVECVKGERAGIGQEA